jgi:type I restriction enzyme M protein
VEVVYWRRDEKEEPMWITEAVDVQLNNTNVQKRVDHFGDFRMTVSIPAEGVDVELHLDGETPFETLLAEALKKKVPALAKQSARDAKAWFKAQEANATYTHRHYITDNEYIAYDPKAKDRNAYIAAFLKREIDHPIIRWKEYDQLGYEILPNKYFYQYEEPVASEVLIEQFWALEKEAEQLLNEIRAL